MTGMIPHHAQAVLIAGWAGSHGARPDVRVLCERIVVGQRDEIETMRTWLRDRDRVVPDANATHHRMKMNGVEHDMLMPGMLTPEELARLDKARGPEWDRLFLEASKIRDLWGASRAGGARRHKGIDIHARRGTPVVAICDGVIVERNLEPVGGKTLWLKSSDHGWKAYYAHLDRQLVREGQYVRKGQVIGTIGNTGNARTTPSHLHFGIAGDNGWVNPLPYVKHSPKVAAKVTTAKKTTSTKTRRTARR